MSAGESPQYRFLSVLKFRVGGFGRPFEPFSSVGAPRAGDRERSGLIGIVAHDTTRPARWASGIRAMRWRAGSVSVLGDFISDLYRCFIGVLSVFYRIFIGRLSVF